MLPPPPPPYPHSNTQTHAKSTHVFTQIKRSISFISKPFHFGPKSCSFAAFGLVAVLKWLAKASAAETTVTQPLMLASPCPRGATPHNATCPCLRAATCPCARDATCPCAHDATCPCPRNATCPLPALMTPRAPGKGAPTSLLQRSTTQDLLPELLIFPAFSGGAKFW